MLKSEWQVTHSIIIERVDLISDNQRKVYVHVVFDMAYLADDAIELNENTEVYFLVRLTLSVWVWNKHYSLV